MYIHLFIYIITVIYIYTYIIVITTIWGLKSPTSGHLGPIVVTAASASPGLNVAGFQAEQSHESLGEFTGICVKDSSRSI